jgi:hypothetical protein
VRYRGGEVLGRLVDVVIRWDGGEGYPPLTGVIARVGARPAFVPANAVEEVGQREVVLSTARLDLRDFEPRDDEITLAAEVMDHQLVDLDGARVVRASDLYLATVGGSVRLVGLDVGLETLLRRVGPARWRTRPTPDAVIDWASVRAFGSHTGRGGAQLTSHRGELNTLRSAELADLVEDLGRRERHQLLGLVEPDAAADALEEMDAGQLRQLLAEVDVSRRRRCLLEIIAGSGTPSRCPMRAWGARGPAAHRSGFMGGLARWSPRGLEPGRLFDAGDAGGVQAGRRDPGGRCRGSGGVRLRCDGEPVGHGEVGAEG